MDFAKGTPLDKIFDALEQKIKNLGQGAKERLLQSYDNNNHKTKSTGEILTLIKDKEVLECGCCYKLSAPVMDMAVVELSTLLSIKSFVKEKCKDNKEVMDCIEHSERVISTVFDGILEIVKFEVSTGKDYYTPTMEGFTKQWRDKHPDAKPTVFDNILGMTMVIEDTVSERKNKKEA